MAKMPNVDTVDWNLNWIVIQYMIKDFMQSKYMMGFKV